MVASHLLFIRGNKIFDGSPITDLIFTREITDCSIYHIDRGYFRISDLSQQLALVLQLDIFLFALHETY